MRIAFISLAAAATIAACQPTADQPRPGADPVSISEVISVLDATCGATRPSFSGVENRMAAKGLTIQAGEELRSPTSSIVGRVTKTQEGTPICWVGGTHQGDLVALQEQLVARYGGAKFSDYAYFGTAQLTQYDRGSKGKMLISFGGGKMGDATTNYLLGIVGE